MTIQDLLDFINDRDPALRASFQGVPREKILACEKKWGIHLPQGYVDFLIAMGENSGKLRLLAPYDSDFEGTETQRESPEYEEYSLPRRYFKIAYDEDDMCSLDLYLDLDRSDGQDAPLVEVETGFPDASTDEADVGLSFVERVTERVFWNYALKDPPDQSRVFISMPMRSKGPSPGWKKVDPHLQEKKIAADELLMRLNFTRLLPSLPRISCFSQPGLNVSVEVSKGVSSVVLELAGDDRALSTRIEKELLAAFSDSFRSDPEQHFHNHENYLTEEFRNSHSAEEIDLATGLQTLILHCLDQLPADAECGVYYTNPELDKVLYLKLTGENLLKPLPNAPSRDFDKSKKGMNWDRWAFDLGRSLFSVRDADLESLPSPVKERIRSAFKPMQDQRVGTAKALAQVLSTGNIDFSTIHMKVLARIRTDGSAWDGWKAATFSMSGPEGYLGPLPAGAVAEEATAKSFKWKVEQKQYAMSPALSQHLQHFCLTPETAKFGGASRMGCPDDFHVYRVLPGFTQVIGFQFANPPAAIELFKISNGKV